jgi:KRAB domain-containing zinc finger protein
MKDHMLTHENVYRFYCEYPKCDKKYNTRSNLEVHMRKHAGTKPFVCELCNKKFISKWNMSKH